MVTKNKKQGGFTLIELLVVVIIVAVLAAVGIPLLSGNVARARASEAEAGLGTIRTSMRARLAEVGTFTAVPTFAQIGLTTTAGNNQGGDLDGRFFDDDAYTIASASGTSYCVNVTGASSIAPRATQVQAPNLIARSMDQNGTIYDAPGCLGGGGAVLN